MTAREMKTQCGGFILGRLQDQDSTWKWERHKEVRKDSRDASVMLSDPFDQSRQGITAVQPALTSQNSAIIQMIHCVTQSSVNHQFVEKRKLSLLNHFAVLEGLRQYSNKIICGTHLQHKRCSCRSCSCMMVTHILLKVKARIHFTNSSVTLLIRMIHC